MKTIIILIVSNIFITYSHAKIYKCIILGNYYNKILDRDISFGPEGLKANSFNKKYYFLSSAKGWSLELSRNTNDNLIKLNLFDPYGKKRVTSYSSIDSKYIGTHIENQIEILCQNILYLTKKSK